MNSVDTFHRALNRQYSTNRREIRRGAAYLVMLIVGLVCLVCDLSLLQRFDVTPFRVDLFLHARGRDLRESLITEVSNGAADEEVGDSSPVERIVRKVGERVHRCMRYRVDLRAWKGG